MPTIRSLAPFRAALVLLVSSAAALAQTAPAAPTPPMGWNSWNHFAGKVSDKTIRDTADLIVSSGMKDAGYVYVNIDDTWQGKRDAQGNIQANERFPDMKGLADYVHSKGLKIGIYSSPGDQTCAHFEGSLGHEQQDADTYAKWGFDYLKYDLCGYRKDMAAKLGKEPRDITTEAEQAEAVRMMQDAYTKMHEALARATAKTGRPIVLSLCQYGWGAVWRWGAQVGGNLWRTTGDIEDKYLSMETIGFEQAGLARFAGPGHWNDPDMLEIGNGGMTAEEYRTHMSLWCLLAAPLLAGNDLTKMTPETVSILMNKEAIAIDQDPAGKAADRIYAEGHLEVWGRGLADGSRAIGIFNRNGVPLTLSLGMDRLGLPNGATQIRDLWKHQDLPNPGRTFEALVPPHGVILLRIR